MLATYQMHWLMLGIKGQKERMLKRIVVLVIVVNGMAASEFSERAVVRMVW